MILKILLDTNFLMIPAQFGIDIFKEIDRLISRKFKLIIFQGIIDELKVLLQSSVKKQKEVQIALELTKRCEKIDLNSDKITGQTIDDKIFQLATSNRWIVATNDRKLRKKLRAHQVPVITLRKKAYLIIEGDFSS
ncbi:MAG: PIN domain-containing protein [Promethearchaeota archaeon]